MKLTSGTDLGIYLEHDASHYEIITGTDRSEWIQRLAQQEEKRGKSHSSRALLRGGIPALLHLSMGDARSRKVSALRLSACDAKSIKETALSSNHISGKRKAFSQCGSASTTHGVTRMPSQRKARATDDAALPEDTNPWFQWRHGRR